MKTSRRRDILMILRDLELRRELMVATIMATQERERVQITREQAEEAYDKIQKEQKQS